MTENKVDLVYCQNSESGASFPSGSGKLAPAILEPLDDHSRTYREKENLSLDLADREKSSVANKGSLVLESAGIDAPQTDHPSSSLLLLAGPAQDWGSLETVNFYNVSSESRVLEDIIIHFPTGPATQEAMAGLAKLGNEVWELEEKLDLKLDLEGFDTQKVTTGTEYTEEELIKLWEAARRTEEQKAETRAVNQLRTWIHEKKSLETCIEDSLKEHIELYEKAHAIRLMLHHRDQQIQNKIRERYRCIYSKSEAGDSFDVIRCGQEDQDDLDDFYNIPPLPAAHNEDESQQSKKAAKENDSSSKTTSTQDLTPSKKRRFVPHK